MKKFKFELGERVFVVGRTGFCIISGRGNMEFISGGKINVYTIDGATSCNLMPEHVLQSIAERSKEIKEKL